MPLRILGIALGVLLAACSGQDDAWQLRELPQADDFCAAAQRLVTRTAVPVQLVVQDDFAGFVKSKAVIEGPTIQQFNWTDADGNLLAISCKLKSADHLNMNFGEGTAGPDGLCQDMNQAVFKLIARRVREPEFSRVSFDPAETVSNPGEPGMTGPDWLAPFTMTYVQDGVLHIATKGFIVDFSDPVYARAPERFRGVHYCHLIAPAYLEALMSGDAPPGVVIGREVDISGAPPQTE
jgi:hypothetical protein